MIGCEPLKCKRQRIIKDSGKNRAKEIIMSDFFSWYDIASAVKFYKKYYNSYEEFIIDFPEEVKKKYYLWLDEHNFQTQSDREKEFNAWLFDYTFSDVIK